MSNKRTKYILALGLSTVFATLAHAEGFYAGGALSLPNYNSAIDGFGDGNSGRGPGAKLYGGYQLNRNVAVEAGWMDLGRTQSTGGGSATVYGGFVDAVGTLPLFSQWSLLGRIGVADAQLSSTIDDTNSFGLKAGVGLQYDITPTVAMRVEYEQYHFASAFGDKPDVGQASVGLKIGF